MVLSGLMSQRVFPRAAITLVTLLFLVCSARAQSDGLTGTMPEDYLPQLKPILAKALETSPEITGKRFEQVVQEARVEEARAARLPQVGGNFNYGITQSATQSNTSSQDRSSGFYYNVGASQAVFHWYALKNQNEAAKLSLLATEKSYALFYRSLSNTLRKTYLALVVEKSGVRQRSAVVDVARRDKEVAEAKFADGTISAASREGERLRLREAEFELKRAESEFETNRRRFARLVGMGELAADAVPDEIPVPAHSEERTGAMAAAVLRDNAKSTYEYEIWDLKVREAERGQKIAATRLLPKFGASINYSLENNTYVNGNSVQQNAITRESVGIGGNWPIFDGFATRAAKTQALIARRTAEHQRATGVEQLLDNVQALQRKLKFDAELLEFVAIRRGNAEDAKKLAMQEAELGNVPRGIIENAQLAVLLADRANYEARAAYLGDWCDFVAIAGDDPVFNNLPARYVRAKK
jgi:outer membrane protein TolC